jgi:hypothetical protein
MQTSSRTTQTKLVDKLKGFARLFNFELVFFQLLTLEMRQLCYTSTLMVIKNLSNRAFLLSLVYERNKETNVRSSD